MPLPNPGKNDFPHLQIKRQPDWEINRRKRQPPPEPRRPLIPLDRVQHGSKIISDTDHVLEQIDQKREQYGIESKSLRVIEFRGSNLSLNDLHDIFEKRYSATIVSEGLTRGSIQDNYQILVQFKDEKGISSLIEDAKLYQNGNKDKRRGTLPPSKREDFFNSYQETRSLLREDRIGNRLKEEGFPIKEPFYIDVDLWHSGNDDDVDDLLRKVDDLCKNYTGRRTQRVRTSSLLLLKVMGTSTLANALLDQDYVARVDLPPHISEAYSNIFRTDINFPNSTLLPTTDDPMVCIVDSGVVSGHPLLRNWVIEERDFESGEATEVDLNGHGTAVAGIAAYGDVAECLARNNWEPKVRICSAKVLRNNPNSWDFDSPEAIFPDENRIEAVIEEAIRYFASKRNCRIFNLSLGTDELYDDGRQFPWAELLDNLARELDIVIVVSAGNYRNPPIPSGGFHEREGFQKAVRKQLLEDKNQRLTNPATAALALTVGAIARSASLGPDESYTRLNDAFPSVPANVSPPFSRVGPGYGFKGKQTSVKPELVHYGGNYALQTLVPNKPSWNKGWVYLGEPAIKKEKDGKIIGAEIGTSFACPHISYAAACAEKILERVLGYSPSANLIRAFVANTAYHPNYPLGWPEKESEELKLIGYGIPVEEELFWSHQNVVRVIASDEIEEDKQHLYKIPLPEDFFKLRGQRGIKIALAFDPIVRASRQDYLSHTMNFALYYGLTNEQVKRFKAPYPGKKPKDLKLEVVPNANILRLRPPKAAVEWSTLQVRQYELPEKYKAKKIKIAEDEEEPSFHLLVSCLNKFPTGLSNKTHYSLVITIWHKNEKIELYQHLRTRMRIQMPVTTRVRL